MPRDPHLHAVVDPGGVNKRLGKLLPRAQRRDAELGARLAREELAGPVSDVALVAALAGRRRADDVRQRDARRDAEVVGQLAAVLEDLPGM